MHIPKNYFQDRFILLFLSCSLFAVILNSLLTLLRLDNSRGSYIVQYRGNLGLSAYKTGDSSTFIALVIFGLLIFGFQIALSMKAYKIRRSVAIAISALCLLLLIFTIIVSNALLALR